MATTNIISLHVSKGKSPGKSISARIDYIMNPAKTDGGSLISSYGCAPKTAANEFMLYRSEYLFRTGRVIPNEVLGYHVRQAFTPGEITPEEANKLGKELAARLSKKTYAYVVATHTDRKHIHNHIIICSFPIDGTHKYRDVKRSSKDLVRISDELCREYGLSVIEDPKAKTMTYDKWLGEKRELYSRDFLRMAIDAALRLNPDGFDALMQMMEELGCRIKRGAHVSIKPPEGKRFVRLDSLDAEYEEAALRKTLDGHHVHIPRIPRSDYTASQVKRLVDIESKLREGKGRGYVVWAERNNIDAKAQSVIYLKENHINSLEELDERIQALHASRKELQATIRKSQSRMKEINKLRQAIRDYRQTKSVYVQYRESGWSPKFYNEHRREIEAHKQAQSVYAVHDGKLPTLDELKAEYEALYKRKEQDYAALEKLKPDLKTLNSVRYNVRILERDIPPENRQHERSARPER